MPSRRLLHSPDLFSSIQNKKGVPAKPRRPLVFFPCSPLAIEPSGGSTNRRRDADATTLLKRNLVHSAHAAAWTTTVATCACCGLLVVFPDVGHQSFGGEHQAGN